MSEAHMRMFLKNFFGVQTTKLNCWMVWGNVSFTSCVNAECFHFTIDCCWEQNILIEGAKMSSIQGLDSRCCQQSSVISAEVLSIHQTLSAVAADDRSIEVNFEVTTNQMFLRGTFPRSRWTFEFILFDMNTEIALELNIYINARASKARG